jgi:hypothetical protein
MTLRDELEPFASKGREAGRIVDKLFDEIIDLIRDDPRSPVYMRCAEVCRERFELLFADKRAETERLLFNSLRDRVHLDDVDYVNGDRDE